MASRKSGFVKDEMTERGPLILANRLGEKFVPKGSPFLLPSGDAPISFSRVILSWTSREKPLTIGHSLNCAV